MSISEEEFNRLQTQILDLRNANYELKDKLSKQSNENTSLKEIIQRQKGELMKNKVQGSLLNTIKSNPLKRQDEALLQERDQLQQKLQQQEQEFRLQNDTLLGELDRLQARNTELEAQLIVEKDETSNISDSEVIRLRAENAALLKKLHADGIVTNDSSETASQSSIDVDILTEEKRIIADQLRDVEASYKSEVPRLQQELEKVQEKLRKKQESLLQLQEEKEHLYNDNERLQEEIKQLSIGQQQGFAAEKERLNQALVEKQAEYDYLSASSQEKIESLEMRLSQISRETAESSSSSSRQLAELEAALAEQSERYDKQSQALAQMYKDHVASQNQLASVQSQLSAATNENETLSEDNRTLQRELQDLQKSFDTLASENAANLAKMKELESTTEECVKLAEKRRTMMEDISAQSAKSVDKFRVEAEQAKDQVAHIQSQLAQLQARVEHAEARSSNLKRENQTLNDHLRNLQLNNEQLSTEIEQWKENLKQTELQNSVEMSELQSKSAEEIKTLKESISKLENDLALKDGVAKKATARISELEQTILDKVEERKIGEQKLTVKLRDLQKVAKQEKQRADRLQTKLEDFLSNEPKLDGKIKTGYDDVYLSVSRAGGGAGAANDGDSLSVSSFGHLSDLPGGAGGGDRSELSPLAGAGGSQSSDISQLMDRIAGLQQDKWLLEEKLSHLEASCASLSDDLIEKSKLIENYLIERGNFAPLCQKCNKKTSSSRPPDDSLTGKASGFRSRMKDLIKGDELSSKDVNKRLQNMLEETLTKNIQLQSDVDFLTKELQKTQAPAR